MKVVKQAEELSEKELIAVEIAKKKILEERNRVVVLNEVQRIEGIKMVHQLLYGV